MTTLSLDSNVLIELLRLGRERVRERYYQALTEQMPMAVSALVFNELLFGALAGRQPARQLQAIEMLLHGKPIVDFTARDAGKAAEVRADLERRGERIGHLDSLIAGQALARGWTVVTANTREFDRVDGLTVLDWTVP